MRIQVYEKYWELTIAFTDYNGIKFLNTLNICIDFINLYKEEKYTSIKYKRLQSILQNKLGIREISVRKSINQLVKLGFINTYINSYHPLALDYINAKTNQKRKALLSNIIYSNSSFSRSVNNTSNLQQINFLIKTLIENGNLTKDEIRALMLVDIQKVEKGFLNKSELSHYLNLIHESGFINRKYNQISYLYNLLGKLEDLIFINDILYFKDDATRIFGEDIPYNELKKRDPYLHHLYKKQLKEESEMCVNATKCMVENLAYPVLIASHIKPFSQSDESEAYDADNGILLSKNIDSLFDLGYITFDETGRIYCSEVLENDVKDKLANYSLNPIFINNKRICYLKYHYEYVFEKRFSSQQK